MTLSTQLPHTQTAVVGTSDQNHTIAYDVPIPMLEGDAVLVRTTAVSVNPVDTKMTGQYVTARAIAGCDFAGEIVALGPELKSCEFSVGDRVCSSVIGMNPLKPTVGAFAQYVAPRACHLIQIPDTLSDEMAAAMPTTFLTGGLALFKSLMLPGSASQPTTKAVPVLVYGGSTSSGTAAIQLLRLAGYLPIATCSPSNSEFVSSFGATAIFDYKSPNCADEIREYTNNSLRYALDCITTSDSMKICYAAIGRLGGRYTSLDPYPESLASTRRVVKPAWVLGPAMIGEAIKWPEPHGRPANKDLGEFGIQWVHEVSNLICSGKIRPHTVQVEEGGLEGVLDGMEKLRKKEVSAKKLVYLVK